MPRSGSAHLRKREDGSRELRVNGVFVMDDVETSSERLLARHVAERGAREVLVGGLGLGFTLGELLRLRATRVIVAELEAQLVDWMRDGTIGNDGLLEDVRVEVHIDDVVNVVRVQPPRSLDAIVLDVDNGPDFLVHEDNARLYTSDFVEECAARLRDHGILAIWSMSDDESLRENLTRAFGSVEAISVPVTLAEREEHYWILSARNPRGLNRPDNTGAHEQRVD